MNGPEKKPFFYIIKTVQKKTFFIQTEFWVVDERTEKKPFFYFKKTVQKKNRFCIKTEFWVANERTEKKPYLWFGSNRKKTVFTKKNRSKKKYLGC